jgi:hypothetical protein
MNLSQSILIIIGSLLILYSLLCVIAHYLDFGWRMLYGEWLHAHATIIKKLRTGIFHKFLIFLFLTIIIYGGIRQFLGFIPAEWGSINKSGEFHSYRNSLFSILALLLSGINMYAFSIADRVMGKANRISNDT